MQYVLQSDGRFVADADLEAAIRSAPLHDHQDGIVADSPPAIPDDDDEELDAVMFPRPGHPVAEALMP